MNRTATPDWWRFCRSPFSPQLRARRLFRIMQCGRSKSLESNLRCNGGPVVRSCETDSNRRRRAGRRKGSLSRRRESHRRRHSSTNFAPCDGGNCAASRWVIRPGRGIGSGFILIASDARITARYIEPRASNIKLGLAAGLRSLTQPKGA